MKVQNYLWMVFLLIGTVAWAQENENMKYIEVTGTYEIVLIPDEIHYLIEIKEYWEEEFDKKSKPEAYRTKVPLHKIEQDLRTALHQSGISDNAIRTQEVGEYWRERGHEFLVAKQFDITLQDFEQIDKIVKNVDPKGINSMRISELKNSRLPFYRQKGKVEALKVAVTKATLLVEAVGKQLGDIIRIIEPDEAISSNPFLKLQSNAYSSMAESFDAFRTIKMNYSIRARFEIK